MEERKISEQESIEIITSMISRTKDRLAKGSGNILLMWGYLVVVITLLVWVLLITTHNQAVNWLWFLIWIIGGIATPIMARKGQARTGVKSYSDKLISQIWTAVGLSAIATTAFCLGFLLIGGKHAWTAFFAFALVIVPMGEIMQGLVIREKSLICGGAIGLCAGIFTTCCIAAGVPLVVSWFMPIFIVAFAAMMILPGHILNHKAKSIR